MKLHFFTIPLPFDGKAQELNRFLNAHRVLRLEKHLLSAGDRHVLQVVVETLGPSKGEEQVQASPKSTTKSLMNRVKLYSPG
jgi:hypothetical protein